MEISINMKIMKNGFHSKEGIFIKCPYCECEYLIESKSDWQPRWVKTYSSSQREIPEYNVYCPECNEPFCINYNPKDFNPEVDGYYITKYSAIYDREDWVERYSLTGK